MDKTGDVHSGL